jgi:hypothetical protein
MNTQHRRYKPTFTESRHKAPLLQRMTPLAWLTSAIAALFVIGGVILVARSFLQRDESTSLAGEFDSVAKIDAQAAQISDSSSATSKKSEADAARAANVAVEPQTQPTVVAPTQAPLRPTATLAPLVAIWEKEMTPSKTGDDAWSAPKYVQKKVIDDLAAWHKDVNRRTWAVYVNERDAVLNKFYNGKALQTMKSNETKRSEYGRSTYDGILDIRVQKFSKDGLTAFVAVGRKGVVHDIYDISSGSVVSKNVILPETKMIVRVRYDFADNVWKINEIVSTQQVSP